ncbi:ionotropic receptor 75a-like [Uranotaenia lowii]|uniref:ionotropic receptor 75a-like n=1 Tax=Uranotaenia lowii TaxID=190385 RepID=UPI002478D1CB|nr:ionotropic receptor 75a-like [Uranotaenia lowii]
MLSLKLFIVNVLLMPRVVSAFPNVKLLVDYLNWQKLRVVNVFHCLQQNDDIFGFPKQLQDLYKNQLHYHDISNFTEAWSHHHTMRQEYQKIGIMVDLSCSHIEPFFKLMSNQEYFNASFHWLMVEHESLANASCLLDGQNLKVDAKITLVVSDEFDQELLNVYDVFSVMRSRGSPLNVTFYGNWTLEQGFRFHTAQSEYERRFDFGGMWLKGAVQDLNQVNHTSILEHLTSRKTITQYAMHRFGYVMWELVMRKHNFTMKIIRTSSWGITNTDGRSHMGMIGQIASGDVDACINLLTYKTERIGSFDFTVTVGFSKRPFVFRHPRFGQNRNVFLQPFAMDLWVALLIIGLASATLLYCNCCGESLQFPSDQEIRNNRSLSLLNIFAIACQQGFSTNATAISTRIHLLCMLVFSFMVFQFYSAFIVGYLLIAPPKFMNTLQHLLDSNLKILVEDIVYNTDYLNRTKDPLTIELYQKRILNGERNFLNVSEGIARVRKGGSAFLFDTSYGYPMVMDSFSDIEICDLQEIYLYALRPLDLPLAKGSPFKEMFRITLRKVMESSVGQYERRFFYCEKPQCATSDMDVMPVALEHVKSLFVVITFSLIISGLLLLFEIGYSTVKKRLRRNPLEIQLQYKLKKFT